MHLIETLPDLTKNILYLEKIIKSNIQDEKKAAFNLIKGGICFVKYTVDGKVLFAPSRFIGYKNNSITKHSNNTSKHGSLTNNRIKKILHQVAEPNAKLEKAYFKYCSNYKIKSNVKANFGESRKFWDIDELHPDINGDIVSAEGKSRLAYHIIRERSPRIRQQAIENFLRIHKRVFCEACGFDFQKKYGTHGNGFIECHHSIPLSQMKEGHKTKLDEIILLCSNCHRMVHSKSDWLTFDELRAIIN